jgi:hypothetical protein
LKNYPLDSGWLGSCLVKYLWASLNSLGESYASTTAIPMPEPLSPD